jgi:uncharacterized protein (TIGR00299 family) protein
MKVAYIDGSAGVSGDMLLGALIHAGWPIEALQKVAESLGLHHVKISESKVEKNHIFGTKVNIEIPHEHEHRGLTEIKNKINSSGLEPNVCKKAIAVFNRLAEVEAKIHGVNIEEIHFHEVGAIDAMIDIVGVCKGIYDLGIEKIVVGPLRVGNGYIQCAHGEIPVPGPATSELIKDIPCFSGEYSGEWTTPTGASLIKEWSNIYGQMPLMTLQSVGMGAGDANPPFPNLLRIFIGSEEEKIDNRTETAYIIESEIDDMPGEYFSYINEILFKAAVKDYYITPVYMKKNRPGQLLTVIVDQDQVDPIVQLLFKETSTFGIRVRETKRYCLDRKTITVSVYNEPIRLKIGSWEKQIMKISPEFEDCKKAAISLNYPIDKIYEMAKIEGKKLLDKEGISAQ